MADVKRVSLKRDPYSNVSYKKDNHNIITEPIQRVAAPMSANLSELPVPFPRREDLKKRKNKLSSILSDFKEISESLDETIAELSDSENFVKAIRLFINLFNANLMLLLEYDQQEETNYSDYILLKLGLAEPLLTKNFFSYTQHTLLSFDASRLKHTEPKKIIEALFSAEGLFFELVLYFDHIADGHPPYKPPGQAKIHGLIIDKLG